MLPSLPIWPDEFFSELHPREVTLVAACTLISLREQMFLSRGLLPQQVWVRRGSTGSQSTRQGCIRVAGMLNSWTWKANQQRDRSATLTPSFAAHGRASRTASNPKNRFWKNIIQHNGQQIQTVMCPLIEPAKRLPVIKVNLLIGRTDHPT